MASWENFVRNEQVPQTLSRPALDFRYSESGSSRIRFTGDLDTATPVLFGSRCELC